MDFEVLKGTKDSPPEDQILIKKITDVMKERFEAYGFRPFDTPLIEYFETLTHKYDKDAEIVQEIFKVKDRGDRKLGLRYDLTVPLCRYIASQKQLKLPFRRYHIAKVFRDGPVKIGRLREFTQCDCDVVGIQGQGIEAELLQLFYETYKQLGVQAILEINNNKILRGTFLQVGFKEKDLPTLTLAIDKLKKIGIKGVLAEIKSKKLDDKKAEEAIEVLSSNDLKVLKEFAQHELLKQGLLELGVLVKLIRGLRVKFRVNFSMSRGLNIYTGNIWEAYDESERVTSSIGSGGRYDNAIGNYIGDEKEYPAVGISFGLVPLMACMKFKDFKPGVTDVLVVPLELEYLPAAFKVAKSIRKKKENAEVYHGFKLKKAFDYADYLGAKKLVIIGKKDFDKGKYTLRNLVTKKEVKVKLS